MSPWHEKGGRKEGETTQTIAGKGQVEGRKLRERLFEVLRRIIGMSKKNRNMRKCIKGDDVHILPTNLLEVGPVKTVCCQHRSLSAACNLFPPEAEDHWVHFDHAPTPFVRTKFVRSDPTTLNFRVQTVVLKSSSRTVWGGNLFREFCDLFIESSTGQMLLVSAAQQLKKYCPMACGTLRKNTWKLSEQVAAPALPRL